MHHILGNKVLEYDVDDRGVIVDEREYDRTVNPKPKEWCMEHGIVPPIHARRSVDGTMILLHEDFVAPVLGDEEISSYLYDSNELSEILNSEVWTEMN